MDTHFRPTWAEISLDAVKHNIKAFRNVLPNSTRIMAVVKANAYGHGAVQVSVEAIRAGAEYLGVASLDEALQLRDAGITAPIFVLGYTPPSGIEPAVDNDITIAIYSEDVLKAIEDRASVVDKPKPLKVHIKLDTGMGRIGLIEEAEAIAYIDRALQIQGLLVEGMFTHYACADEKDKTCTLNQYNKFERIIQHYRERGITFPYVHAGNSATGIDTPELAVNMLRLGISLYGLYPSKYVDKDRVKLQPVMAYKTKVVHVKTVPADTGISYGLIYHTPKEETIATIPVGYGDGYTRLLTGKAEVLIRGQRAPVVGNICMDQCMVQVSHIPDVAVGDEVVLFGKQGDQEISADELAESIGTINYEITCMVNHRVPRIYSGK